MIKRVEVVEPPSGASGMVPDEVVAIRWEWTSWFFRRIHPNKDLLWQFSAWLKNPRGPWNISDPEVPKHNLDRFLVEDLIRIADRELIRRGILSQEEDMDKLQSAYKVLGESAHHGKKEGRP